MLMRKSTTVMLVGLLLGSVLPSFATMPQVQITINSGSPYYLPKRATVSAGVAIRWVNPTATHHTVTHEACMKGGICLFDSGLIAPNDSYSISALQPGRYEYLCRVHPIMRGVLIVAEPMALSDT